MLLNLNEEKGKGKGNSVKASCNFHVTWMVSLLMSKAIKFKIGAIELSSISIIIIIIIALN